MGKHVQSIDGSILARMKASPAGTVFSPADFLDVGGRDAVDQALSRNCRLGVIRKVARGLYDAPRKDPLLGVLSPSPDAVARALAQRDAVRLHPSGALAANRLGLSDQVPMRMVFLTDGRARRVQVGKNQIIFRKVASRQMAAAGRASGDVIQALRWIGRSHVDGAVVGRLRRHLTPVQKAQLVKDRRFAPTWVANIMSRVVREEDVGKHLDEVIDGILRALAHRAEKRKPS